MPVINALSDKFHPLQILADVLTLYEVYAPNAINDHELPSLNKLKVAWVGDSNNIVNSMLVSLPRIGISLSIASPTGYESPPDVVDFAQSNSNQNGFGKLCITHSIGEAVKDADVLVTDTWVSMGQEAEKAKRIHDFKGFQVRKEKGYQPSLLTHLIFLFLSYFIKVTETMAKIHGAKHNWKFMHCLPRKPEEVDDEVKFNLMKD